MDPTTFSMIAEYRHAELVAEAARHRRVNAARATRTPALRRISPRRLLLRLRHTAAAPRAHGCADA